METIHVTSHTGMHRIQSKSHCVNSVINNQFLYLKNRSRTLHPVNKVHTVRQKLIVDHGFVTLCQDVR